MSTQENNIVPFWKRLLFSSTLLCRSRGQRTAYIAALTAFSVVANLFFEFKFMDTQYSLTIAVSCLIGVILGPVCGFASCFLGDLLGFLCNSGGYMYLPFVGISMGLSAFFAGLIVSFPLPIKGGLYLKLFAVCALSFSVCSVAINTTAFWWMYAKGVSYWEYFVARFIVKGQLLSCFVNYALIFVFVPTLPKIKPLHIKIV